ncbi:sigma-70 family RNA polymerase sigma factor [bacterium]|nr:sigma-70 family RNA polymerase sigma factor [bacterium]
MKDLLLFRKKPSADKEAWLRACIHQNESGLIRYVKSLVHNIEVSKDIVQDSFLKLWQQDHIKLKGHETPWLYTTSRNGSYDYLRSKKRKAISVDELVLEIPDDAPNSEQQLVNKSSEELLQDLLKKLSPAQQEVMNLKFQNGLSYKEISTITGHSVNHVGVLIHNIVTNLKEKMKVAELKGGRYENK